jgi:uncharacterized protein with PIN domain
MTEPARRKLVCDTCGREVDQVRRDVVDGEYNAITKPPLWNCETCYAQKRTRRQAEIDGDGGAGSP